LLFSKRETERRYGEESRMKWLIHEDDVCAPPSKLPDLATTLPLSSINS
jgi:hypothetical protein